MFKSTLRKTFAGLLGTALLVGIVQTVPAYADTILSTPLQVNFQAQTTTTPSGYVSDYGQAYDTVRGYGWTTTSGTPLNLVGNGRQRNINTNPLLDTFMQMQALPGSGNTTPGAWKASIPNGTYAVTIGVGDPSYFDSHNVINAEGVKIIDFTPTSATREQIFTTNVTVTGGFLNIDANGGTNTKIDFIQVSTQSATSPTVQVATPHNGAIGVNVDTAVSLEFSANVDPNTVNAASFQLLNSSNTQISGHYNVDGAYGSATFQPNNSLAANSSYTVRVTNAMKNSEGTSFTPFTSTFTTGSGSSNQPTPNVAFDSSLFDYSDGTTTTNTAYKTTGPTAMALGPNPNSPTQLWVAYSNGAINVYNLDANGKKVGNPTIVTNFRLSRLISGLRFDPASTNTNIKLWVSNAQFGCDLAALGISCDNFTGALSTLSGANASSLTTRNIVTGLPRSVGNHMNNGLDFDSSGFVYLAQGALNGYGAPDAIWGNRAEVPLSAAILRINVAAIQAGTTPYNVNTSSPTNYNPNATNALVKPYVTGIRNPFNVVWHSNGKLYAPVNESSNGNTPATNTGQAALTNLPAFDDYFTQVVAGKYYGHPNPARGQNFVLNGGNPTSGVDAFEVPQYPVGTQPNSNWRKPDLSLGVHRSADGAVEFKSNVFGSNLQGQILVTEYSQGKDVLAIKLDSNGNAVSKSVIASGFYNPLPIVADPSSGRVYVGEYGRDPDGVGGQVTLLSPHGGSANQTISGPPFNVNFQTATTATPSGYTGDSGAAFSTTTGFGWENNATGAPLSIVGNGRERNAVSDKRLDTLMQMQATSGITTPAKWEAVVPNGTYNVTVAVGDPSYFDSHNVLNAEGIKIVDFTPTTSNRQTTATRSVTVNDGRLTIDPTGGTNTKIDYIQITSGGTPPPPPPPPPGTQPTSLKVTSPEDNLGLGSRMVFSTVRNLARNGHSITLSNTKSTALNVSNLSIGGTNGGDFKLCTGQSTSFVIAGNGSAQVCVQYRPLVNSVTNGTQVSQGTLTINSNDATVPNYIVTLGGLNAENYESFHEPSLQAIFNALGYKDNVAVSNNPQKNSISAQSQAVADEILTPYFKALNTSQPVSLIPLAHYSGKSAGTSASFGWHAKGSGTNNYLYAFPGGADGSNDGYGQNQLLLPTRVNGSSGINSLTFSPGGSFGLVDNYPGYSNHSDDNLNSGKWHNLRIYPAKNAAGTVIPGAYLVGNDIGSPAQNSAKNWDYQDFAFLLLNATPDTASAQPTPGEYNKTLGSFPGNAGGIAGSGFTTAQGTINTGGIAYANGQLKITTANDTNTSHTNALQLGVNAGVKFRVQSRLVGPFDAINAGAEQQGIYFGPNGNNYIKAEVEWNGAGNRVLTIWKEVNGVGSIINSTALPGGNANTIDLRIDVDPSPQDGAHYNGLPLVVISYALNGSTTFTRINPAGTDLTIPSSWITANTPAGIVQSHQQGGSPFVASYANFAVTRN